MEDDYYYYEDDAYNDYGEAGDAEEAWDTSLQSQYDDAKAVIDSNPTESIRQLKEVMAKDTQSTLWTFKCLKKLARASRTAKNYDNMLDYYAQFIAFTSSDVDDTMRMKAMMKFMDRIPRVPQEYQLRAIEATLTESEKNMAVCSKLWLSAMLRKATILTDRSEDAAALGVLTKVRSWCISDHVSGNESQLCAAYALLLKAYNRTAQFAMAREVYYEAMSLDTASGVPVSQRVMASILEWGGHMFLRDSDWHAAYRAFHMAFRFYSDCGDTQATSALKFAVVADMICGSPVDSFAANESKASAELPSVQPVARLLDLFTKNDVTGAIALLRDDRCREVLVDDKLLAPYIEPLLFRLRLNILVKYVTSFSTVALADVAAHLCLERAEEATDLCTFAILQRLITASVDDSTGMLHVHNNIASNEMRRCEALLLWSDGLSSTAS